MTCELAVSIGIRRNGYIAAASRRRYAAFQHIAVGDVSTLKPVKARMAKSVLNSGQEMLERMLLYKGEYAGRSVSIVNERNTNAAT